MLKSRLAILFLVFAPLLAACGGSVTVGVMSEAGESVQPVTDQEVLFYPFDRDSVFAAMAAQASTPEPQVPADIQVANDSVLVLQEAWRSSEAQWNTVRDSLRQLSERLQGLDQRSREYLQLFEQFNPMERRERSLNQQRQAAFDRFTGLQQATQARLDSVGAVIQAWEDQAFADYADVETDLLAELGREVVYDTTGADGYLTRALPTGLWWVHTRVAIPGGELYWNVPHEVTSGDTLRLVPGNAERRLVF